jgi:uncharacterized protein YoxC
MNDNPKDVPTLIKHSNYLLEQSNTIHMLEKNVMTLGAQINDLVQHLNRINNEAAAKILKLEQRTAELELLSSKKEDKRVRLVGTKDESYDT